MARPIIKWVGGKTQLLPAIEALLPRNGHERTYFEPFMGGAAVFFHLAQRGIFSRAVLNDWNPELVNLYRSLRDFPEELMAQIDVLQTVDPSLGWEARYYAIREMDPTQLSPVRRAARTVYLNKNGFNGLYRQNKSGKFNVPWGKKDQRVECYDPDNIRSCSQLLNDFASLHQGDFLGTLDRALPGDLVYLDPPYVPLSKTSDFTAYTSEGFDYSDQQRLAIKFRELAERGVYVLLSNSDTPLVRELYDGFEINEVHARRNINSKGAKRGPVGEVIVVGRAAQSGVSFPLPLPEE